MSIPGEDILQFRFLKVELINQPWRKFIDSNNPVAAALLAKMGYNKGEERELHFSYLRMLLKLSQRMLQELAKQYVKESETIMEFMPSWMRQGYEKGLEEGMEKGIAQGTLIERQHVARRLLSRGFSPKEVADTLQIPIEEINKIIY
ncbi:hypothetical protein AAL85_24850 [Salmonella enterica subsp. enterica serovar Typhi]|nr:hypothetical protein [Salmonella enterica subsp. enterica serovar Typhi]